MEELSVEAAMLPGRSRLHVDDYQGCMWKNIDEGWRTALGDVSSLYRLGEDRYLPTNSEFEGAKRWIGFPSPDALVKFVEEKGDQAYFYEIIQDIDRDHVNLILDLES